MVSSEILLSCRALKCCCTLNFAAKELHSGDRCGTVAWRRGDNSLSLDTSADVD